MKEEQELKLTDLDYLTGDHHLQMLKAALPFMKVPEQKALSVFVKINELQRTLHLFEDESVAAMGISPMDSKTVTTLDMLKAIKPYGNTYEQDLIDILLNFMQGMGHSNPTKNQASSAQPRIPIDQIKNILPPEQQSKLEQLQMIMQAMQQFA